MSSNIGKLSTFATRSQELQDECCRPAANSVFPRQAEGNSKPHANAWSILWRACLPYLLIAVAFGGYYVIAKSQGWVP